MKLIPLSGEKGAGKYIKVDKAGYIKAMRITKKWYIGSHGYACTGKGTLLHRILMNHPDCKVDHIDGDKLNCKGTNLRLSTDSIQQRNKPARVKGRLGVKWYPNRAKPWMAKITINRKAKNLGYFHDLDDARRAYRDAALKLDPLLAIRHAEEWADL